MSEANTEYFQKCGADNGSVNNVDGTEYALTQQAYICDDGKTYQAAVISLAMLNEAGDTPDDYNPSVQSATAFWEITCFDSDDESNVCDWDKPLVIELS